MLYVAPESCGEKIDSIRISIQNEQRRLSNSELDIDRTQILRQMAFLSLASLLLEGRMNDYRKYIELKSKGTISKLFENTSVNIDNPTHVSEGLNQTMRAVVLGTEFNQGTFNVNFTPVAIPYIDPIDPDRNMLILASNLASFPLLGEFGNMYRNERVKNMDLFKANLLALFFVCIADEFENGDIEKRNKSGGRYPVKHGYYLDQAKFWTRISLYVSHTLNIPQISKLDERDVDIIHKSLIPAARMLGNSTRKPYSVEEWSEPKIIFTRD
ncbi:MAG: hypothetical protein WCO33_01560 [bacterium]